MAKTQSLSKVQLRHPSLVDHNSQECPRQQVQQQGNEGETLRLKEITFLSLRYFQKLTFFTQIYIFRAVEVGKAEGVEMFGGGDGHRAAEKVRNKFAPNKYTQIQIQIHQIHGHRAAEKVRDEFAPNKTTKIQI